MPRSLDGLVLAPVADQAPGQVGTRTRFAYHEQDGRIWAEYAGGDVVRGHLVGTREGDRLDFRYVQLKHDGTTSSGHCLSQVTLDSDGRVRLEESWAWESQDGSGTSVVEEVPGGGQEAAAEQQS
ncbi:hypothetical protein GCM10010329_12850 [Streptomyces spiroverticillatus]|uniref:N-acetylglutamate synthase n=1 Tax=Streptomyces finlayi TaxID=67296 RepID=A0A919CAC4_9ACTN|nr:hypothetical protein [Streptomyces finlayi]GGZ93330.1 hypothetical protein GCM10010329_12850 [Streptomyces spiroverticillatus]GHC92402.1 hypothetical protein GCM10010334_28250 [Streptomyces finlayi]